MDAFKNILESAGRWLKQKHFTKNGNSFYINSNGNWGVINFQKSRDSTSSTVIFTINLGICSNKIRRTLQGIDSHVKPSVHSCHWQKRIGNLLDVKQDYWWKIQRDDPGYVVLNEIIAVLDSRAVPEIEKYIADECLQEEWLKQVPAGTSKFDSYRYLTALLYVNHDSRFSNVAEEYLQYSKSKGSEDVATEYLTSLQSN